MLVEGPVISVKGNGIFQIKPILAGVIASFGLSAKYQIYYLRISLNRVIRVF